MSGFKAQFQRRWQNAFAAARLEHDNAPVSSLLLRLHDDLYTMPWPARFITILGLCSIGAMFLPLMPPILFAGGLYALTRKYSRAEAFDRAINTLAGKILGVLSLPFNLVGFGVQAAVIAVTSFKNRRRELPGVTVPVHSDIRRIEKIKSIVTRTAEGRKLLTMAEEQGIAIVTGKNIGRGTLGSYGRGQIKVSKLSSTLSAANTLFHELRHMWQDETTPFSFEYNLLPHDRLMFHRLYEGDARAFAAGMMKIVKNPKLTLESPVVQKTMARVFKRYQRGFNVLGYDKKAFNNMDFTCPWSKDINPPYAYNISTVFNEISRLITADIPGFRYLEAKDDADFWRKMKRQISAGKYNRAVQKSRKAIRAQIK